MATPLRVLVIDGPDTDPATLLEDLGRSGYDPSWQRVDSAPALEAMAGMNDGRRRLDVQTVAGADETIAVSIRDTGVGVPDGAGSEIFDAFFTTKPEGLGLGLSISRSLIEAHGGRLWVQPNGEAGATFGFSLPVCGQGDRGADIAKPPATAQCGG